jgi:Right handed beta helix region
MFGAGMPRGPGTARFSRGLLIGAVAAALLASAPAAMAHIERASYWPDPGPDTAGGQPTGGAVPEVRPLFTALDGDPVGETRVVCVGGQSLAYRPDQEIHKRPDQHVSKEKVKRLKRKLKRLEDEIHEAGGDAPNKEEKAEKVKRRLKRARREYRKALAEELAARQAAQQAYEEALAAEQAAQAAYDEALAAQPSIQRLDASLADAVANGYELRPSEPPIPVSQEEADELRDFNARLLGECRYASIQAAINDSGNNDRVVVMPGVYTEPDSRAALTDDPACDGLEEVNDRGQTGANSYRYTATCPNDQMLITVVGREPGPDPPPQPPLDDRHGIPDEGPCIRCNLQLEGSGVSPDDVVVDAGNVDSGNGAPPDPVKDVGIKIDRADGFVLRNMTVRHAREHGIYPHEVDGYVLDRFKVFYNEEYGVLAFASDHGLIQDCDAAGAGDAGIYPGSAPDTGEEVTPPDVERLNTEIRRCDMHHNAAGYSGTAANAVWVHHNDFYDNALGFTTDVFTAAGHPGFPQDSDTIENNEFYSNNFNPYVDQPDDTEVVPTIPVPVGTGLWIAGGNNNTLRNNYFWDNWRRGTMVFSVPDAFVCGPQTGNSQHGCDPNEVNTSFDNEHHDNVMGMTPGGTPDPNGTDFWWDQFAGNTGNCWFDNVGMDGDRDSLTADPPLFPTPGTSTPGFLPEDCDSPLNNGGGGDNETELVNCLANFEEGAPTPCTWFTTPPEPQP